MGLTGSAISTTQGYFPWMGNTQRSNAMRVTKTRSLKTRPLNVSAAMQSQRYTKVSSGWIASIATAPRHGRLLLSESMCFRWIMVGRVRFPAKPAMWKLMPTIPAMVVMITNLIRLLRSTLRKEYHWKNYLLALNATRMGGNQRTGPEENTCADS